MKLSTAIESLLSGERTRRISCNRTHYGYSLELVGLGRRFILDLVH